MKTTRLAKFISFILTVVLFSGSFPFFSSADTTPSLVDPEALVNLFDPTTAYAGYINGSNQAVSSTSHYTGNFVSVTAGDVITFGPCNPSQGFHLHGYNGSGQITDNTVRAARLTLVDSFGSYVIYSYTVPENVSQVRLINASKINSIFTVTRNQSFDTAVFSAYWSMEDRADTFKEFGSYFPKRTDGPLYQKSALFVGDSISAGTQEGSIWYRAWAGRIGVVNDMDYVNASVSGASCSTTRTTNRIVTQLLKNSDRQFDYVVLHGGVNDAWDTRAPGKISEGFDLADFDTTTFAGGLEEMFFHAVKSFPNARIGYIMNFKAPLCTKGTVANMDAYFNVAKKICEKWGMPYLNLYEDTEFCNNVLKVLSTENLPDHIHPNTAGYDLLYPVIEKWMESLPAPSLHTPGSSIIEIDSEEDLINIKSCLTADYILTRNVFLTKQWKPISVFEGTLDGSGYSIVGLDIKNAATTNWGTAGLFGQTTNAEIKNLSLYGTLSNNVANVAVELGAFVGNPRNTLLENCVSYVSISTGSGSARVWAGGIAGLAQDDTVFKNCVNHGAISIRNQSSPAYCYIGGICGQTNTSVTFEGCENNGDIDAMLDCGDYAYVGGICSYLANSAGGTVLLKDCQNNGFIQAKGIVGGICAFSVQEQLTIDGCVNTASLTATNYTGGILATAQTGSTYKDIAIKNCVVTAVNGNKAPEINATKSGSLAGGIFAYLNAKNVGFSICGCVNTANVTGGQYAGGIVGYANNANTRPISITYCTNLGSVVADAVIEVFVGGILGRGNKASGGTVSNCYNGGTVSAPNKTGGYVGGIAGSEGSLNYDCDITAVEPLFGYGKAAKSQVDSSVLSTDSDLDAVLAILNRNIATPVFTLSEGKLAPLFAEPSSPSEPQPEPQPEPPVTDTTETPTTEIPTPGTPTTEIPTTEIPTTEIPTTEIPTTESPLTNPPTPSTSVPTEEVPSASADGCGSTVAIGGILAVAFCGILICGKKQNDEKDD